MPVEPRTNARRGHSGVTRIVSTLVNTGTTPSRSAPPGQPSADRYGTLRQWIVRRDPQFHTPYSAFNVLTGEKHGLTGAAFIVLKIAEGNLLTAAEMGSYLGQRGVSIVAEELSRFLDTMVQEGLLTKAPDQTFERSQELSLPNIWAQAPVTSTPYEIELHLTNACNLVCRHCAYAAGRKIPMQLAEEEWCQLIDEIEALDVQRLVISGGEPLVLRGAARLVARLATKRIRVDLLTNGTKINSEVAARLSSSNFSTTVSVDGADAITHDALRGRGSFDQVIRGLRLLSRAGAVFHIATTLHRGNKSQIEQLAEAGLRIGAQSVNFILLDPIGRAALNPELWLSCEDVREIGERVQRLASDYGDTLHVGYLDPSIPEYRDMDIAPSSEKIFCAAGTTRLAIRSDGHVFPCVYAFHDDRFAMGSVRTQTVKDIWQSAEWRAFRGAVELGNLKHCARCALASQCTTKICRLRAHYASGDFLGRPPSCPATSKATKGGEANARPRRGKGS